MEQFRALKAEAEAEAQRRKVAKKKASVYPYFTANYTYST